MSESSDDQPNNRTVRIEIPGKELIEAERKIDLENAALTEQFLENGQLGERAPEIYENLGGILGLLSLLGSCHWGCRSKDHDIESLIRRCCNYAFASLNLARMGFYDESLALIRGVAEVSNLLEIFAIDNEHMKRWKEISEKERKREYSPVKVRLLIEASGKKAATDEETYNALCALGIHVTPESMRTSHQPNGRVHIGACFSAIAFLAVLNELAINLSPVTIFAGYLLKFSGKTVEQFREACNILRGSCTDYVRAANYQRMMEEIQKAGPDSS